jgi:uridine phosphorylase
LKRFFDSSPPLLKPTDTVFTFTGKSREELLLPLRAIIVFDMADLKRVVGRTGAVQVSAWSGFRPLYRPEGKNTVITRSYFGGPNVAALVEELSAFGVKEFVLWGYCGGIRAGLDIGSIILAQGALREDGVSYHYLEDEDPFIYSDWFNVWKNVSHGQDFHHGTVWSSDAIFRETENKVTRFQEMGILGVEMEVASFYAVCKYIGAKCIAFLVVSD